MAIGSLRVEVTASIAQLEKQLRAVEQKLAKTGQTIDNTLATPGAKMAVNMGKVFAVMGTIEFAAKAASAGVSLLDAFSAQAAGNAAEASKHFDAVAETIKQLPMGIGPVAAALEDLMHKALGVDEAMRRVTEAQKDADARRTVKEMANASLKRVEFLKQEIRILTEVDAVEKLRQQNILAHDKLRDEVRKKKEEIYNLEGITLQHENTLLNKLEIEHGLQQDILNIQHEQAEAAIKQAENQKKQDERLKSSLKMYQEFVNIDQKRLNVIQRQLGTSDQGTMGDKTGLTSTISTALGSFTTADLNVEDKLHSLTQESNALQSEINNSTKKIESLTKKIAENIGVS